MIRVRRHERQLASGKTVKVRQHERQVQAAQPGEEVTAWDRARVQVTDPEAKDWSGTQYFWQDGVQFALDPDGRVREVPKRDSLRPEVQQVLDQMKDEMREWRNSPEPYLPPEPMTPQMAKLLGCDTPEGRAKYERLRAYRESGYRGPLDQDNNVPDPDDPEQQNTLETLAHMRAKEAS